MDWWHTEQAHKYVRWHNKDQQQSELDKRQSKLEMMQVQGCRAVVQGWSREVSPAMILGEVQTAVKVETFYQRNTGRRGDVIVSFRSPAEKDEAIEKASAVGIQLTPAYSSRSNGNAWHRIRTHWADSVSTRMGG